MSDETKKNELLESLHELGRNLKEMFQSAWNSQERQEIKETVEKNLHEIGETLNKTFSDFSQSPEGQRLRVEVDDLRKRVESGELTNQLRNDVLDLVKLINKEIEKASSHWSSSEPDSGDKQDKQP
jgi:hypothetical protein